MVYSQFFILSSRGDVIIFRDYRGDLPKSTPEHFFRVTRKDKALPPFFVSDGVSYLFQQQKGLFFVLTSKGNCSPSFTAALLSRISQVIKDYCGMNSEEAIRKNFVLIYELLDEMMDFGYPQETSTDHLKAFVYNKPVLTKESPSSSYIPGFIQKQLPQFAKTKSSNQTNKPIAWDARSQKSTKNEIYVDLIERITVLFNSNGSILKSEIDGCVRMKSYLSGQPELRLGLNEDIVVGRQGNAGMVYGATIVDDMTFHQACRLQDFDRDRVISLQAPEGECIALNYRINQDFDLPFRVFPFIEEIDSSRTDMVLKIRSDIPSTSSATIVTVSIPLPQRTTSCKPTLPPSVSRNQTAEYLEAEKKVIWTIKKFQGHTEQQLRIRLSLKETNSSIPVQSQIGPISMDFEIPMWNPSSVSIRFLHIIERSTDYKPHRWVRIITQSSSYTCRIAN